MNKEEIVFPDEPIKIFSHWRGRVASYIFKYPQEVCSIYRLVPVEDRLYILPNEINFDFGFSGFQTMKVKENE